MGLTRFFFCTIPLGGGLLKLGCCLLAVNPLVRSFV